jgi:hypothetical protein
MLDVDTLKSGREFKKESILGKLLKTIIENALQFEEMELKLRLIKKDKRYNKMEIENKRKI